MKFAMFACAAATAAAACGGPVWKAGVSRVPITPEKRLWLEGYGDRDRPLEGVREDIWAKALAIEDPSGAVGVVVTYDLCEFDRRTGGALVEKIGRANGLPPERIIINTSHTHSAPLFTLDPKPLYPLDERQRSDVREYAEKVIDKSAALVGEALAKMRPARLSHGEGTCRFAVNRRCNEEAALTPATELAGSRDHSVPVLKVEGSDGKPFAILFGYACHNTVMKDYLVCGDYAGYAQAEVERLFPGSVALFFQGAGADMNPLPRRKASLAKQYGKELAATVEQVLSEDMAPVEGAFSANRSVTMLPMEEPTSAETLAELSKEDGWRGLCARSLAAKLASGDTPRECPYPIVLWRLGDLKIFAMGGEIMSGYAVELKKRHGRDTFVMGYCYDVMSYMPTPDAWADGGYEIVDANLCFGLPGPWTRDVFERIIGAADELASGVRK